MNDQLKTLNTGSLEKSHSGVDPFEIQVSGETFVGHGDLDGISRSSDVLLAGSWVELFQWRFIEDNHYCGVFLSN